MFTNTIWPNHAAYVQSASTIPKSELAQRPEAIQLRQDVLRQMTGMTVVKVKIYNLAGLTVFSTDPRQIGEDKSTNSGFATAKDGGITSEITFRDKFDAFEQVINDRNLVSSYLPIRKSESAPVEGVMEVYSDVTDYIATLERTQWKIVGGVLASLSLLYMFLLTIVRRADTIIRAQSEEARLTHEALLIHQANSDSLTGLANRPLFHERLRQIVVLAGEQDRNLALVLIDIERFKTINDSLGRPAGDTLLKELAARLARYATDVGQLARIDADHFALMVPDVQSGEALARLIEQRLGEVFGPPFRIGGSELRVSAKFGIAMFPSDGTDVDTLFKNAEAALKNAKAKGERYLFYTQTMNERVAEKLSLENNLRQALDKGEFVLHYQPKVNLASGKLTSAEALLRWNDPRTGLVPPFQFIPILEETGLIHEVGRWVLRKAIEDYLRWRAAGLAGVRIAVNVSPLQLRHRGFIAEIEQVIGIDPHAAAGLELEITESLIMEDVKHSIATLEAIRAMGVTIAIDDFGTGFSSLSYLSRLPVDTLKIDRSFVIGMTTGPQGLALVSTIINLAHALKLKVVAGGVETEEQSRLLQLLNCDEMQGYLFSKPLPVEIFQARYLAPLDNGADGIIGEYQQLDPPLVIDPS